MQRLGQTCTFSMRNEKFWGMDYDERENKSKDFISTEKLLDLMETVTRLNWKWDNEKSGWCPTI